MQVRLTTNENFVRGMRILDEAEGGESFCKMKCRWGKDFERNRRSCDIYDRFPVQ